MIRTIRCCYELALAPGSIELFYLYYSFNIRGCHNKFREDESASLIVCAN